jgi:hypothetical protein
MSKLDDLANKLAANQDKEGSPEFNQWLAEYKVLALQEKFDEANKMPESPEKLSLLDRLRTQITNAGGVAPPLEGSMVTKATPAEVQGSSDASEGDEFTEKEITEAEKKQANAPAPKDVSGAPASKKILGGGLGAAVGAGISSAGGVSEALAKRSARVAGMQEQARIAAQRSAGITPTGIAGPAAQMPPAGSSVIQSSRQPIPFGAADAGRMAAGQTGVMPYNYAKAAGLTDIEAARALDMTKNPGGVHDLSTQRREGLNKVGELFPEYRENPRYGGLMTSQSSGGGPRVSYQQQPAGAIPAVKGPVERPPGSLYQVQTPTRLTEPPKSGLQTVSEMYRRLMDSPVVEGLGRVAKKIAPPVALAGAGLDLAEIEHELRKKAEDRDYAKMALKGLGLAGSGLSLFPATMPVGVALGLGAPALEYAREKGWDRGLINDLQNQVMSR